MNEFAETRPPRPNATRKLQELHKSLRRTLISGIRSIRSAAKDTHQVLVNELLQVEKQVLEFEHQPRMSTLPNPASLVADDIEDGLNEMLRLPLGGNMQAHANIERQRPPTPLPAANRQRAALAQPFGLNDNDNDNFLLENRGELLERDDVSDEDVGYNSDLEQFGNGFDSDSTIGIGDDTDSDTDSDNDDDSYAEDENEDDEAEGIINSHDTSSTYSRWQRPFSRRAQENIARQLEVLVKATTIFSAYCELLDEHPHKTAASTHTSASETLRKELAGAKEVLNAYEALKRLRIVAQKLLSDFRSIHKLSGEAIAVTQSSSTHLATETEMITMREIVRDIECRLQRMTPWNDTQRKLPQTFTKLANSHGDTPSRNNVFVSLLTSTDDTSTQGRRHGRIFGSGILHWLRSWRAVDTDSDHSSEVTPSRPLQHEATLATVPASLSQLGHLAGLSNAAENVPAAMSTHTDQIKCACGLRKADGCCSPCDQLLHTLLPEKVYQQYCQRKTLESRHDRSTPCANFCNPIKWALCSWNLPMLRNVETKRKSSMRVLMYARRGARCLLRYASSLTIPTASRMHCVGMAILTCAALVLPFTLPNLSDALTLHAKAKECSTLECPNPDFMRAPVHPAHLQKHHSFARRLQASISSYVPAWLPNASIRVTNASIMHTQPQVICTVAATPKPSSPPSTHTLNTTGSYVCTYNEPLYCHADTPPSFSSTKFKSSSFVENLFVRLVALILTLSAGPLFALSLLRTHGLRRVAQYLQYTLSSPPEIIFSLVFQVLQCQRNELRPRYTASTDAPTDTATHQDQYQATNEVSWAELGHQLCHSLSEVQLPDPLVKLTKSGQLQPQMDVQQRPQQASMAEYTQNTHNTTLPMAIHNPNTRPNHSLWFPERCGICLAPIRWRPPSSPINREFISTSATDAVEYDSEEDGSEIPLALLGCIHTDPIHTRLERKLKSALEAANLANEEPMRPNCSGRHIFHHSCITSWLARKSVCPLDNTRVRNEALPVSLVMLLNARRESYERRNARQASTSQL